MEEPLFFKNRNGQNLFGVLHSPEINFKDHGFIFCAPTFGEKTKTYRVFVNFARFLERNGYYVLRFDYFGEGDSAGNFEEADIESRLSDIKDAVRFFKNKVTNIKVNLLGLRLGASLSILTANEMKEINSLILWAPIVDLRLYLFEFLRGNLSNQLLVNRRIILNREQLMEKICSGEKVNVDGWLIGKAMWEQSNEVDLKDRTTQLKNDCIIINFLDSQSKAYSLSDKETFNRNIEVINYVPEFTFSDWKNYQPNPMVLFEKTLEWVRKKLN